MTEEAKRLIKSVKTFAIRNGRIYDAGTYGWLIKIADFDRVVEGLTKWNKVKEVGYPAMGSEVVVHRDIEIQQKYVCKWTEEEERWADMNAIIEWRYIY
jgi:hypothetical protein